MIKQFKIQPIKGSFQWAKDHQRNSRHALVISFSFASFIFAPEVLPQILMFSFPAYGYFLWAEIQRSK